MRYTYTTLAIGSKYLVNAIELAEQLNKKSTSHSLVIINHLIESDSIISNTIFKKIDIDTTITHIHNVFNYNLKYLSIEEALKINNNEFIIYLDSDWLLHEEYSEDKMNNFLQSFSSMNLDVLYERPHKIGDHKNNPEKCFWKHKIQPYNLLSNNRYDHANVVNEQFLLFKHNSKIDTFVNKWKFLNFFGIENQIWPFAEGVEIGMSIEDAAMKSCWKPLKELSKMFRFKNISGHTYERF